MRNSEIKLDVISVSESFLEEPLAGTHSVVVKLKKELNYNNYTAKIKGNDIELKYDADVDGFFYNDDSAGAPNSLTVIVTEKSTQKSQEIVLINKN